MIEKAAYTVDEVAALTAWSRRTVIRVFEKEPGVLMITRPEGMHKRRYRKLTIPRGVYERVIKGVTV